MQWHCCLEVVTVKAQAMQHRANPPNPPERDLPFADANTTQSNPVIYDAQLVGHVGAMMAKRKNPRCFRFG